MEAITFLIVLGVVMYYILYNPHLLQYILQFFIFNISISSLFLLSLTLLLFFSNFNSHSFLLI